MADTTGPQQPRTDGRYGCCIEGDEQPCPQRETGHDLPCNAPYCRTHNPRATGRGEPS